MSSDQKQLSACLARYMDTKAFTAVNVGKEQAERLKVRREIATKRARAAIRFFEKPENFARLSLRIAHEVTPAVEAALAWERGK